MSKTIYDDLTLADWLERWCENEMPERVIFVDSDGGDECMWFMPVWNEIWRCYSAGKVERFKTKDVWAVWLDENEDLHNYLGIEWRTSNAR